MFVKQTEERWNDVHLIASLFSERAESHFCEESPSAHFILWGECTSESIYAMCMCCCKVQRSETREVEEEEEEERHRDTEERERKWIGL